METILNKFYQRAIMSFYTDSTDICSVVNDNCDICIYRGVCWDMLEIDYLNLQFFKTRD